jgi:hypothetical protein
MAREVQPITVLHLPHHLPLRALGAFKYDVFTSTKTLLETIQLSFGTWDAENTGS